MCTFPTLKIQVAECCLWLINRFFLFPGESNQTRPIGDHLATTWQPLSNHSATTWRPLGGDDYDEYDDYDDYVDHEEDYDEYEDFDNSDD